MKQSKFSRNKNYKELAVFLRWKRFLLAALVLFTVHTAAYSELPDGFTYLDQVDPTIQISMRYYSNDNFAGTRIDGYKRPRIIMTKQAAAALKKVQQDVAKDGYCLVVYDAYRPQKAVDHFMRWGADLIEQKMKPEYYPDLDKKSVFDLGYIAKKSGHTRGSTVDLTIIKLGNSLKNPSFQIRTINGNDIPFLDDGTVDMGSSFDLFDDASHHDSPKMTPEYNAQRKYLRSKMEARRFKILKEEWWHYILKNEPFPNTYFNFDIE
jgi:zinc D-Ala-D-Ala dipeptidase